MLAAVRAFNLTVFGRLAASIIVPLAYGYKVQGDNDPIVQTVDKAMEDFAQAGAPGAFLADVFPFRECAIFSTPVLCLNGT